MASSRKLKKHCRIMPWIEAQDKEFADALSALCLEGQLSARRGGSGVTFLYPGDQVRKDFVKLAFGSDAEKAVDLFEAHVIPTCIKSASGFSGKIGSMARVQLTAKSTSGDEVVLDNGAVLKPAKDFSPLNKRKAGAAVENKIAVWVVSKGAVPTEGASFDPMSLRGKTGGGGLPSASLLRVDAIKSAESEFLKSMSNPDVALRSDLPLLKALLGLLATLADPSNNLNDDLLKALCALDRNPACLYILVEPYKQDAAAGEFFLSDDAIRKWGGRLAEPQNNAATALLTVFDRMAATVKNATVAYNAESDPATAAVFNNAVGIEAAIAGLREQFLSRPSAQLFNQVVAEYDRVVVSNQVGSIIGVWPEASRQAFENSRKFWQDSLRHCLRLYQTQIKVPTTDPTAFANNFLGLVRDQFPGTNYGGELSSYWGTDKLAAADAVYTLSAFVNSDDFVYIPYNGDMVDNATGGNIDDHPLQRDVWRGQALSHRALKHHAVHHRGGVSLQHLVA